MRIGVGRVCVANWAAGCYIRGRFTASQGNWLARCVDDITRAVRAAGKGGTNVHERTTASNVQRRSIAPGVCWTAGVLVDTTTDLGIDGPRSGLAVFLKFD
jgi:hypothetical protein